MIHDPDELATKFVNHFKQVSSDENYNDDFLLHKTEMEFQVINFNSNNQGYYNRPLELCELQKSISLSNSSTPGEDNIHYDFIKELPLNQKET